MEVPLIRLCHRVHCTVVERLNRFTVLVDAGGRRERAYITNTGRLHDHLRRGAEAYCIPQRPGLRTRLRLIAVSDGGAAALIDTQLQMKSLEAAWALDALPWARGCRVAARNPRLGGSVLDYLLECPGRRLYVEVKSAVLLRGVYAAYPDCPTLRGRRHVEEIIRNRGRAALVFVAALPGVEGFTPCREGDPVVAELIRRAVAAGVEVHAVGMYYDPRGRRVVLYDPDLPVVV